jgi:micrococcal nuclease
MRTLAIRLLASLGLLLTACKGTPAPPLAETCRVTHIVDGDTIHLTCNGTLHKVRLLGYDTPEIYHPHCAAEKQAGDAATDLLRRLIESGPVTGVAFAGLDRYGRDLARVSIGGQDVSAHMLASPLALPYQGHRHPEWCARLGA